MVNGSSLVVTVSEFGEAGTCEEGDGAESLNPSFSGTLITTSPPLLLLLSAMNGSRKRPKARPVPKSTIVEKHTND